MKKISLSFLLGASAILYSCGGGDQKTTATQNPTDNTIDSVLLLSDVHLSVSFSINRSSSATYYGNYNGAEVDCDTTQLKYLQDELAAKYANMKYAVCAGDFNGHYNGTKTQAVMKDQMGRIYNCLKTAIPGVTVIPAMGNNDFSNDYVIDTFSYQNFYDLFVKQLNPKDITRENFKGYYAYDCNADFRIIVLNTVMFDNYYSSSWLMNAIESADKNYFNIIQEQAQNQLKWLAKTLEESKGKKVWLLYHIPPGNNRYASHGDNVAFWDTTQNYKEVFDSLVFTYKDIIKAQIGGHSHMDDYMAYVNNLTDLKVYNYIHIAPGMCANHYNNPAFQMLKLDSDKHLNDIRTHYLSFGPVKWQQYDFTQPSGFNKPLNNEFFEQALKLSKTPGTPEYTSFMTNYFNLYYTFDSAAMATQSGYQQYENAFLGTTIVNNGRK